MPAAFQTKLLKLASSQGNTPGPGAAVGSQATSAGPDALAPDEIELHLYLTEIYPTADFAHPPELAAELLRVAGPFVAQPSRQQVVLGGASDIATYFEEQVAQGTWYERALRHALGTRDWDVCLLKWHSLDWTNHLFAYATEPRHPLYEPAREAEAWRRWDQLFAQADRLVGAAWEASKLGGGPDAVLALTSDHGSEAVPPGLDGYADLNGVLEREGWLVRTSSGSAAAAAAGSNRGMADTASSPTAPSPTRAAAPGSTVGTAGGAADGAPPIDWARTRAYAFGSYVWLNVRGRDPDGVVEPGDDYRRERDRLIATLLAARDPHTSAPLLRTCWPIEDAAPLGVGGDRTGDVFVQPWHSEADVELAYRRARELAGDGRFGTWDWPAVNAGGHHPHTFLIVAGPGVRAGYRRPRAALLSAIAPTLCTAAGLPVPHDADGTVLWDALA